MSQFLNRIMPDQILYTEMITLYFPKFHKFYEVFDEKIQQLFTAGIVNFLSPVWVESESKKKYAHLHLEELLTWIDF